MESVITHPHGGVIASNQKDDINPVLSLLEALDIEVLSETENFIACPGSHLHTTANSDSDCTVYPNPDSGRPVLYCHHSSCRAVIVEMNRKLTVLAGKKTSVFTPKSLKPFSGPSIKDINRLAAELLKNILKDCKWSYQDIASDPKGQLDVPEQEHHLCIFDLFESDDIIWTGRDVNDTGYPKAVWRFKTAADWFARYECPGQYTCPSTFQKGVCGRTAANVKKRRFLVVESDKLTYDETGAVFRWLIEQGSVLRAVVDTANKSLHGWFDWPKKDRFEQLKGVLPLLKCDPKMFGASQPCRLPGAIRSTGPRAGSRQRLIFFKK